ncbi:hypothetical protein Tco_0644518 [Tanacetum coccineum]
MEVLTLIIQRRVRVSDTFRYHNRCEELQLVNICFADDLFIFTRGYVESTRLIIEALDEFKKSSGLIPSIPKSMVFFRTILKLIFLVPCHLLKERSRLSTLGFPLFLRGFLIGIVKSLLKKSLIGLGTGKTSRYRLRVGYNYAGRFYVPYVYWAAVLVIPIGIIQDIEQLMRGFLWCNRELKWGKEKVTWDIICLPKCEGDLGIRSLEIFNMP